MDFVKQERHRWIHIIVQRTKMAHKKQNITTPAQDAAIFYQFLGQESLSTRNENDTRHRTGAQCQPMDDTMVVTSGQLLSNKIINERA